MSTRLQRTPGLDVRPAASGEGAFALRMRPPGVVLLDDHARFILELAGGRSYDEARQEYEQHLGLGRQAAFAEGVRLLIGQGLLEERNEPREQGSPSMQ